MYCPLMQWPTQPTGPGFALSLASNQARRAAVSSTITGVCQMVHRGADHRRHAVVAMRDVETHSAEPVIHVRQQAEIAVLGDPARHVAQFLAHPRRIHVENDPRMVAGALGAGGESRHAAVLGRDDDVFLDHGGRSKAEHASRPAFNPIRTGASRILTGATHGRCRQILQSAPTCCRCPDEYTLQSGNITMS